MCALKSTAGCEMLETELSSNLGARDEHVLKKTS